MISRFRHSDTLAKRLDHRSEPYVEGQCRLWLACRNRQGYGLQRWQGRMVLVHRATWECERGPIPEGLCVLHRCDNPPCRNIDHLFLGSQGDNQADKVAKGRQSRVHGERHGLAKLTEVDVLDIRAIQGVPQTVIAAMYGLNSGTVSRIRSGERWTHLAT